RDSPEQLGLHQEDIERLRAKRDKLSEEKKNREKRLKDLRAAVEALWEKLEVDMGERKAFLNSNRGCGVRQINEFEDELNRLNELKRQNLHLFVEDARYKLQELWDALYLSEDEMLEFTPAFSDVYSDALLEAHEREIQRLEALKEQRAPTLELVDRHKSLTHERNELAASSQDASRLMLRGQKGEKRDPGKLLREEKMRKRIAKELPKITVDLRRVLEQFEDEFGRPFLVHGERYLDVIEAEDRPAPGPRSKTPGAGAAAAAPASMTRPKGHARANSTTGIARPPTRNGARTPAPAPSVKRSTNNMNSAIQSRPLSAHAKSQEILRPGSAMGTVRERAQTLNRPPGSPSRIPARPPLTNLKYGTNSPERQLERPASRMDGYATIRGGAPMRAPPPKMRDLNMVELETPANPYKMAGLGGSIVRQVELEDPYDEDCQQQPALMRANSTLSHTSHASHASHASYASQSSHHSVGSSQHDYHSSTLRQYPPSSYSQAPPPRQISNSSNGSSNVTGSENWETYDDASEPEQDATDTYYAKVRAARGTRFEPEAAAAASRPAAANDAKRPRPFPMMAPPHGHVYSDGEGNRIISGSEWTDEDGS
ncbi:Anaphase spindle elongation protein 1, partial [Colletotrichum tanaceti]